MSTQRPISPRVLVVGAAGRFAGLVVPELARRGVTVRGLVRDAAQAVKAQANGATETAIGDLNDPNSIKAALAGADLAFYLAPVYQANEAEFGLAFVAAAKAAGVRRIAFSSAIHPTISALENHIAKTPVEGAIVMSGMEFTILNPAVFYQNSAAGWPAVEKTGMLAEPFSARAKISRVDYRDVAEIAAIALTEDRLRNGTFELCADNGRDRTEVAAIIGDVLGRPIAAAAPTFDEWAAQAKPPYDEDQMAETKRMYDYYDEYGLVGNDLTLRAVLGREPRTLHDFFADLAAGRAVTA